ncbi:hypothetical protein LTR66_005096 [Elasticomyces elasticus]|nr:hypothetical protein LTR66_005096 [Elasticomyces elasticus]KAK5009902.1 hypothetical protein LTR28_012831 [Elasticomyces elasticus]
MSFGFSAGDFIAATVLIKEVVQALRGSAAFEYRELILELHGLELALKNIEHLQPPPGQESAVNAVKVAALMCQYALEEFAAKLEKYKVMGVDGGHRKRHVVVGWARKAQWNVSMQDEVAKLRAYLAAHVGSLNIRLMTLGLSTVSLASTEAQQSRRTVEAELLDIKDELKRNGRHVQESVTGVGLLHTLFSGQVLPQLTTLIDLAAKVWTTNTQIIASLTNLQSSATAIDVKHTWFQEPFKLEDAYGRTIPVPSEYGWGKLEAIILDQFSSGPGHAKVFAGEYELFSTDDSSQAITWSDVMLLKPGASITMAVIIGRYEKFSPNTCPKPGCRSQTFNSHTAGGRIWYSTQYLIKITSAEALCSNKCLTWFGPSKKSLPRPFRLLCMNELQQDSSPIKAVGRKRKHAEVSSRGAKEIFQQIRSERKWFKNMRVHLTDMSEAMAVLRDHPQRPAAGRNKRAKSSDLIVEETVISSAMGSQRTPSLSVDEVVVADSPDQCPKDFWPAATRIICEELGVEAIELENASEWDQLCIDSLMHLVILSRLREDLHLEFGSELFIQYSTVVELRDFMQNGARADPDPD